jgi:hypothetical protein
MNKVEFLIPKKDLLVRDPITRQALPAKGAMKPLTGTEGVYWRRRINDGSVVIKKAKSSEKKIEMVEEEATISEKNLSKIRKKKE